MLSFLFCQPLWQDNQEFRRHGNSFVHLLFLNLLYQYILCNAILLPTNQNCQFSCLESMVVHKGA